MTVGMRQQVIDHLAAMGRAHRELVESLLEEDLSKKLADRSNTIGAQLWCVVGARESYARAIESDGWVGFSCSLSDEDAISKKQVVEALARSETLLAETAGSVDWTETRDGLLLDLLEHEAQHQGQIIRYMYALGRSFPESWVGRWALDQPDGPA
jgi:uncharacterized damage-inducible protein DinB